MRSGLVAFFCTFLLGCSEDAREENASLAQRSNSNLIYKNSVYFPGGEGVEFHGELRRYELFKGNKGEFERYTVEFSEELISVERAVSATMAKHGYQRKVRRESVDDYFVSYTKEGVVPVAMYYDRVPFKNVQRTRLRIIWRES
ncbi:hypothetical protein [Stutzerimonas stutzeri]|uniref:hypothetical protein n=1 Tax=Stutzerimonas stutzeri TaxID=316 RepID=UPI000F746CE6|nr:hypothetical protein [Stutzerimonas stutzeri]